MSAWLDVSFFEGLPGTLILILLAGVLDRIRGSDFHLGLRVVDKLSYGWVIAALMGHPLDMFTPIIAALLALGMSPGWGAPLGAAVDNLDTMNQANLESWQVGPLKTNIPLALVVRGAMWGAPVLLLLPWLSNAWTPLVAYTIAFPASVYIARKLFGGGTFKYTERLRGCMAAGVIALLGVLV